MESTIFYCKKCDSVFAGAEGQISICPTCKSELIDTHCSEAKWDSLGKDEKISLKQQWKGPVEKPKQEVNADEDNLPGLIDMRIVCGIIVGIIVLVIFLMGGGAY